MGVLLLVSRESNVLPGNPMGFQEVTRGVQKWFPGPGYPMGFQEVSGGVQVILLVSRMFPEMGVFLVVSRRFPNMG